MEVPVDEPAEEERGETDADRGVASEQGDCDTDEADLRHLDVEHAEAVLPADDVEAPASPANAPEIAIAKTSSGRR